MMTINDIDLTRNIVRPPISILLDALYMGITVEIDGRRCVMANTVHNGQQLVIKCDNGNILGWDPTISQLSEIANKLTEQELFQISANITLNKVRIEENKRRNRRAGESF